MLLASHWPILGWIVWKGLLQKVDLFENYAIVAMQSDIITFYACKIAKKGHQALIWRKQIFSLGGANIQKPAEIFSNANNSTTLMPQGTPGVSKEAKLSSKFEFGSLVR